MSGTSKPPRRRKLNRDPTYINLPFSFSIEEEEEEKPPKFVRFLRMHSMGLKPEPLVDSDVEEDSEVDDEDNPSANQERGEVPDNVRKVSDGRNRQTKKSVHRVYWNYTTDRSAVGRFKYKIFRQRINCAALSQKRRSTVKRAKQNPLIVEQVRKMDKEFTKYSAPSSQDIENQQEEVDTLQQQDDFPEASRGEELGEVPDNFRKASDGRNRQMKKSVHRVYWNYTIDRSAVGRFKYKIFRQRINCAAQSQKRRSTVKRAKQNPLIVEQVRKTDKELGEVPDNFRKASDGRNRLTKKSVHRVYWNYTIDRSAVGRFKYKIFRQRINCAALSQKRRSTVKRAKQNPLIVEQVRETDKELTKYSPPSSQDIKNQQEEVDTLQQDDFPEASRGEELGEVPENVRKVSDGRNRQTKKSVHRVYWNYTTDRSAVGRFKYKIFRQRINCAAQSQKRRSTVKRAKQNPLIVEQVRKTNEELTKYSPPSSQDIENQQEEVDTLQQQDDFLEVSRGEELGEVPVNVRKVTDGRVRQVRKSVLRVYRINDRSAIGRFQHKTFRQRIDYAARFLKRRSIVKRNKQEEVDTLQQQDDFPEVSRGEGTLLERLQRILDALS